MSAVYVLFSAPINNMTSQQLMVTLGQLINQQNTTSIELLLSTTGGDVPAGMAVYNFLRSLPIPINTHNISDVASIGNTIFLAGSVRKACTHSTFTFHGVGFFAQNITLDERTLKDRLGLILADHRKIEAILRKRTKISAREARKLIREPRAENASYALRNGIISAIEDVSIPRGAPIVTIFTGG